MAHLKPSRLAVLLKKTLPWELATRKDCVVTRLNGTQVDLPYAAITDLDQTPGWLWSTLRFRTAEGDIFLPSASKVDARNLIEKITPRITAAVTSQVIKLQEPARRLFRHLDTFLTSPKYLAQR